MRYYRKLNGQFRSRIPSVSWKESLAIFTLILSPLIACHVAYWLGLGIIVVENQSVHTAYAATVEEEFVELPVIEAPHDFALDTIDGVSRGLAVHFSEPGYRVTEETEKRIRYLFEKATLAGHDPVEMAKTIYCESLWFNIQSGYIDENGVQEDSWGIVQIHLPSHRDVSREEAMDPYWAIDWMVEKWGTIPWYGYDAESGDRCTNGIAPYW